MAEQILTLRELEELFQEVTLDMLGYIKSGSPLDYSDAAYYAIRVSHKGGPAWDHSEDVCSITVKEEDEGYNRQHDVQYANKDALTVTRTTGETTIINVQWVFYGPNAFEKAREVKRKIFYQEYHDFLASEKVFVIPDIQAPRRAPELWPPQGGKWWERWDLNILFNALVIAEHDVSIITSAEIEIDDLLGQVADIVIVE